MELSLPTVWKMCGQFTSLFFLVLEIKIWWSFKAHDNWYKGRSWNLFLVGPKPSGPKLTLGSQEWTELVAYIYLSINK